MKINLLNFEHWSNKDPMILMVEVNRLIFQYISEKPCSKIFFGLRFLNSLTLSISSGCAKQHITKDALKRLPLLMDCGGKP